MTSFEFILISIAIVVGFGISEILAGWGRQIRHRYEVRPYPLQIVASAYLLSLSIRFLWLQWGLRDLEWTNASYFLVFLPALILALTAHLMQVDVVSLRRTPREQYFAIRRPFFALLVAFPIIAAVNTVYLADYYQQIYGDTRSPFQALLPIAIAAYAWMFFSDNPRHHWVAWGLLWVVHGIISATVLPSLGTP